MDTDPTNEILDRVQKSLKGSPYECNSLEKLSGGTANFVYRGILKTPLEDGTKSVVIKHTEEYVASNKNFKLTSTRCTYEQTILTALHALPPTIHENTTITTPHLYQFSPTAKTQIYSDLPSSLDLKTYVLTHPLTHVQASRIGFSLGQWAKSFHIWANAPQQEELRKEMGGNRMMKELKFRINYGNLVGMIDKYPEILGGSREILEGVNGMIRKEIDEQGGEGGMLIHGDFWSGNVLLPNAPLPSPELPLKLFIIDWELSHSSSLAFDLGQMFAELYELKYFKDIDAGVWLIQSFMEGYGDIDEELAYRVAIHVGTHLICFGSGVQGWGSDEQVRGVVEEGGKLVVTGKEGKREVLEGLGGGVWRCLFH